MKPAILVLALLAFSGTLSAQPKSDAAVLATVTRIYSAASAGDSAAFLAVVPAGGYTEFPKTGGPLVRLDSAVLQGLFTSLAKGELKVNLRATELQATVFGDAALVTGFRVGSITAAGEAAREEKLRLTMVLARKEGDWKIVHVHLSPFTP